MLLSPLQREAMQSFINSNSPLNHYVTPESVHRRLPQGDANLEPRMLVRKRFQLEPSNLEIRNQKRRRQQSMLIRNWTSTELGIIRLAANVLRIPLEDLLRYAESQSHSETSSTSVESSAYIDSEEEDDHRATLRPGNEGNIQLQSTGSSELPAAGICERNEVYEADCVRANQVSPSASNAFNINAQNDFDWGFNDQDFSIDSGTPFSHTQMHGLENPTQQDHEVHHDWDRNTNAKTSAVESANTTAAWNSLQQGPYNNNATYVTLQHQKSQKSQNKPGKSLLLDELQLHSSSGRPAYSPSNYWLSHEDGNIPKGFPFNNTEVNNGYDDDRQQSTATTIPQQLEHGNPQQGYDNTQGTEIIKLGFQQDKVSKIGEGFKARRRGPLSEAQRQETCMTRKLRACIRCQRQQIKCNANPQDPQGWCITCRNASSITLSRFGCLRYKISDSQLIDKGPHPRFIWTRRWSSMKIVEINQWHSPEIRTITLTQDVGGATYDLQVRQFIPVDGDSLNRAWKHNGIQKAHACTPWAIANMAQTGQDIASFVDNHIRTFINFYIDSSDKLIWETYNMAFQHSRMAERKEERDLLRSALKLWVASRMESKREKICSKETLDMSPQNWDPESDNYNTYLVPPVLQAQIELLTTVAVLLPMKQAVLKGLQALMKANQTKSWFAVYLCLFILLHSCSLLTKAESMRAKREPQYDHNEARTRFYDESLVEEFHNGAKIMLAHFHYGNKGGLPFILDWTSPAIATFAELDSKQEKFMQETTELVKQRSERFKILKDSGMFEDDYFFVSQLYETDWKPIHTV